MEYISTLTDLPGNVTVDVFANADAVFFAMQGRKQGALPETRTSALFTDIFKLYKALRSENDAVLAWSPFA